MKKITPLTQPCEFKRDFSSKYDSLTNFFVSGKSGAIKRIGYKTLRGYIHILKQQNACCKKHNIKVKFDITLPIPD